MQATILVKFIMPSLGIKKAKPQTIPGFMKMRFQKGSRVEHKKIPYRQQH